MRVEVVRESAPIGLFNSNVASLFPKVQPSAASLVTLVLMIGMSWVVGYVWTWLYNRFAKIF